MREILLRYKGAECSSPCLTEIFAFIYNSLTTEKAELQAYRQIQQSVPVKEVLNQIVIQTFT